MNNASNNSGMTSKQIKAEARKEKASRIRFGQNYQFLDRVIKGDREAMQKFAAGVVKAKKEMDRFTSLRVAFSR